MDQASDLLCAHCPLCGCGLLSKCEYTEGKGYLITWACGNDDRAACDYRRVL